MSDRQNKVLIVCASSWLGVARLPKYLSAAGFHVATISDPGSIVTASQFVDHRYYWSAKPQLHSDQGRADLIRQVDNKCQRWKADWLIPGDDESAMLMLDYAFGRSLQGYGVSKYLQSLIRRSLSENELVTHLISKHKASQLARSIGVRVPEQSLVRNALEAYDFIEKYGLPIVLKVEYGSAGRGVEIVRNLDQVPAFFQRNMGKIVAAHRYIQGILVMRTGISFQGEDLAGLCLAKRCRFPDEQGPSSVVEWLDHEEIERFAQAIMGRTELSGFHSFDFMLETSTDKAYFIECNLRPTPVAHLGALAGRDLCQALYHRLNGLDWQPGLTSMPTVALFPQEWQRDPRSTSLTNTLSDTVHDVPWDEPELLKQLLLKAGN